MKILLCLLLSFGMCFGQDVTEAVKVGKAISGVAKKSFPSVVVVENIQDVSGSRYGTSWSAKRFGTTIKGDKKYRTVGLGSGFVIRSNGYIVTNHHVVKGAEYLRVRMKDGTIYDGLKNKGSVKIIGLDEDADIAVLKIAVNHKLPVLEFADSDKIEIGEWAIAIGAPFSFDYTLTVGVVSQLKRHGVFKDRVHENYVQTDASINSGNSGGPLLNIYGKVIGVNDFIVTDGRARNSAGLGFAIASNLAKKIAERLIATGGVERPWLGIMMKDLSYAERIRYKIAKGVYVIKVEIGSPANLVGIMAGDVIVAIDDHVCNKVYDVQGYVLQHKAGGNVVILLERGGKMITKTIQTVRRTEKDMDQGDVEKVKK